MKKLLTSLAVLAITSSTVAPILATVVQTNIQEQSNNSNNNNYKQYQAKNAWEKYMNKNQAFINLIKKFAGLGANYQYKESELALETINDKAFTNKPIGTLLMNGKIHTIVGSPNMASQHIIDNSDGPNPITVNYDSKTVSTNSTISACFSGDITQTISATAGINVPFTNASISASLSFNFGESSSTSSSVEQTVTFDTFSTTIDPGDKVEINYVVMQNLQVFNMVLKSKLDLNKSKFKFTSGGIDKIVTWSNLAKNQNNSQIFANQISKSLSPSDIAKGLQPLITVDKIYDPTLPDESQFYNPDMAYIYLPLSFNIDGYSTLITQSKI